MSDIPLDPSLGIATRWKIAFSPSRASVVRPFHTPIFDDDPNGLVIFGDSSAIYMAKVASGAAPYSKLSPLKATTYIHGWAWDAGNLYVIDGVELSAGNLGDAAKRHSVQLVSDADAPTAKKALTDLKNAIQIAEWAA